MNTDELKELEAEVSKYGQIRAFKWLEGVQELDITDEAIEMMLLSRKRIEWDNLPSGEQDRLRDVFLESVKEVMAGKLTPSSSPAVLAESRADAPGAGALAADQRSEDSAMLDWIQEQVKTSSTGVAFQKIPACEGEQGGFRFMRRHWIGEAHRTVRSAIKAEMARLQTSVPTGSNPLEG